MAKKFKDQNQDIIKNNPDDEIDPSDLADDLIVDGGDELTKEPEIPEDMEDIELEDDLDLDDDKLAELENFNQSADDSEDFEDDFFNYGDDDSDSY